MKKIILFSLLAIVFLRVYPIFLPTYQDPDVYFHLRMTEQLIKNSRLDFDALSDGGRAYTYYPLYHFAAAEISELAGTSPSSSLAALPILIAIAAILIIAEISKKMFGEAASLFALFFAVIMPAYLIRTAAYGRPDCFALLLIPLLLFGNLRMVPIAAIALSLVHPISALFAGVVLVAVLVVNFMFKKKIDKRAVIYLVSAAFAALYYLRYPLEKLRLAHTFTTSSEMQAPGIFLLMLIGIVIVFALVGIMPAIKKRSSRLVVWFLAGLGAALYAIRGVIYFAPIVAVLGGAGLAVSVKKLKKLSLPFVVFVFVVAIILVSDFNYNNLGTHSIRTEKALRWAEANTPRDSVFLSMWDRGHVITEVAKRKVVVDGYFEFVPDLDERVKDSFAFLNSCNKTLEKKIVEKYKINYIFVDWSSEKCIGFNRVYDNGKAKIYSSNLE